MAINYTTLQVQVGALLRMSRKIEAKLINARDADNANYDRRLLTAASGFSTSDNEEARVYSAIVNGFLDGGEVPNLESRFRSLRAAIENQAEGLGHILAQDLDANEDDLSSAFIDYLYDPDLTDGTITILRRTGLLGALRRDMELAAISQYVTPNVITIGALTAAAGNVGTLTATSASAEGHCPTGTLTIECVNERVSTTEFSASIEITVPFPDGTKIITGDNLVRAEKSWQDGPTGITMVITRSGLAAPTELTDADALFATTSFTTPRSSDSDRGVFYVRVTRQATAPIWLIEFFADQGYTRKVGHRTETGTVGTAAGTTVMNGGTSITTTFSMANADTAMATAGETATASWDIVNPRIGDKWTRSLSNDEAGLFSTKIMKLWRGSLPGTGANLWTDANASSISMS